jgi:hypothetical protein
VVAVNQLYGSSAPGQPSKSRRKRSPVGGNATSSAQYLYQINFRAPKNGVDSSWFIDFFIGNGPNTEDPNTWLADSNLIGSHAIIAMQNPQLPQVTITGVVMLNTVLQTLVAQGRLANMELDTVLAMLQSQMAWRIKTVGLSIAMRRADNPGRRPDGPGCHSRRAQGCRLEHPDHPHDRPEHVPHIRWRLASAPSRHARQDGRAAL